MVKEDTLNSEKKHSRSLKVVVRRLPPSISEQELLEQMSPLPDNDYFKFVPADYSLSPWAYSRAYLNLTNAEDVILFRDRFNGYVFVDAKGNEFPAMVEFAPLQKIPTAKPKKDAKCNTIDDDIEYKEFLEQIKNPKYLDLRTIDATLAEIEKKEKELKEGHGTLKVKTPLIEFIEWRKEEKFRRQQEKRRQREEERKRREEERKKRIAEEALRKQREKEKREKEAAKKAATKPERAPRFDKNRDSGSKYEEDWDKDAEYPDTRQIKSDYPENKLPRKSDYPPDIKPHKSTVKPPYKEAPPPCSGANKARNYNKYDDSYDYAPPPRRGGASAVGGSGNKKPYRKEQSDYYDSPQQQSSSARKLSWEKKYSELAEGGKEENKSSKTAAEARYNKRDDEYVEDFAPNSSSKSGENKKAANIGNKGEEFKKPRLPDSAESGDSSRAAKSSKSRYKDKPSMQLYQPGKNRKLVESQEKPLVFQDADED